MLKRRKLILFLAVLTSLAAFLYIMGDFHKSSIAGSAKTEDKKDILYWTCGMHPTVKQDKPGKCPICAMVLIPIYKEEAGVQKGQAQSQPATEKEEYYGCGVKEEGHCPHCDQGIKDAQCICGGHSFLTKDKNIKSCPICKKPLQKIEAKDLPQEATKVSQKNIVYYRNPMNSQITSPTPMKDEMGMDYIPVYAVPAGSPHGEAVGRQEEAQAEAIPQEGVSRVHLSENQMQLAGIKTEPVFRQKLSKEIRTVGKIAYDPELAVAQEEFLTALETKEKVSHSPDPDVIARAQDIVDKSKFRLRLLGMNDAEISQLEKDNNAQLSLVLPEDKAWVYADVYEYDLGWVKEGQDVKVTATAYPADVFGGVIKSISPVLDPNTRAAKARIEVDNPGKKLKPEMYVDVIIENVYKDSQGSEEILSVPRDAVLDTGLRKIVYVDAGNGAFIGKEIKTGSQASVNINGQEQSFYPVLSGLNGNEMVVTKGNFLIDSQSQLTGGMSVLWGGASEIKTETPPTEAQGKIETQHKH